MYVELIPYNGKLLEFWCKAKIPSRRKILKELNSEAPTYTVQLKGNVALARYCLAHFSNTIHLILDTRQRSLAVY